MAKDIRVDEWLVELERVASEAQESEPEGALSTEQLREVWGCGIGATRKHLRKLLDAGLLDVVRVKRLSIDGVTRPCVAYRLKPAAAKKKRSNAP